MNGINIGNNVTFKNNKAEAPAWGGGALYIKLVKPSDAVNSATPSANQTVTIDTNAVFTGNEANSLGGAIALEYGQLTIAEGARFENNKADTGGAIAMWHDGDTNGETSGSQLNISKADFSGNEASLYGGALFLADTAGGEVTITDSTFTGNKSELLGGAIFNAGTLTITGDNTFTGNTAAGEANDIYNLGTITVADGTTSLGGGLTLADGTVTVTDSGTLDGTVTWESGSGEASKGLIVIESDGSTASVTLNGGMDTGENASASVDSVSAQDLNVTLEGIKASNNVLATSDTGAYKNTGIVKFGSTVGNGDTPVNLTVTQSEFTNNTLTVTATNGTNTTSGGAAISFDPNESTTNSNLIISESTFEKFKTTNVTAGGSYGGAIGVQDNTAVELTDVILNGNTAKSNNNAQGGGYYQANRVTGTLSAQHVTATNNTADGALAQGGGMALFGVEASIADSTFTENLATGTTAQGGAIYNEGTLTVEGSTFTGNKAEGASGQGGAIANAGTLTVDGGTFTQNSATLYGGAIGNAGTLTVAGINDFSQNSAQQGGAIINIQDLTFDGIGNFSANTATANDKARGGAIYNASYDALQADLAFKEDSIFKDNKAEATGDSGSAKGGAIFNYNGGKISFEKQATFIGNTASAADEAAGGAIYNARNSALTFNGALFENNRANGDNGQGGAIYNAGTLTLKGDNLFTGNNAAEGKDIYNTGTLDFAGTNTQMDGGMVMADGTMTVANSQVNMAELDARDGKITVTGSELSVSKLTGNTLGSSLTVGTDGIVNIGNLDTTKLGEAMNDAGMGSGSAVLALNTTMTLDNNARLVVGTDASENGATAVFGENSLLVVDAEGVADKRAIHADGQDSKTAFIHSGAQLRIINAVADEYVTILNGFDTIQDEDRVLGVGWTNKDGVENLDYMLSSYAMITDEKDVVVVSELNDPTAALPGIDPDLAPVLNEVWANKLNDVDSPDMGVRFLSRAARADYINGDAAKSAATIESAARIAFAGAVPQMTRMASDAATNAVVNRLGFANPADGAQAMNAEGKIVDRNTTGFALWIAPLWQNQHGWGMEAGNLDYGFNGNLGGVSLGADYTFENAIRAGITFNIGGGYAESSGGDLNSTENRMTFWGLGAYAGWNYENFGLMADVSYTSTWNDLEQDLDPGMGMGDLEADVQATAISAGLRAEYKLETSVLDIIPHIGVRYMSLNTWGYDVDANGGTVLEGDGFHQDIWTFPIGVTFSKDFTLDSGWFFKPSVDFSVIPAAGDIKAKHDVQFTGAPAVAEMETQMMDYLTWQGGVGIQMGNDNLSFGVNYTLQAGQNTTGHGVFGSFRYEF